MKNSSKLYVSLIFFSIFLSSQELDESFLKSLPDDIKKDLEEQNLNRDKRTQSNYRPYLYSSKLSQAEEIIDLKERLELDLIELERRLDLGNDLSSDEGLKLYGSDFFNTFQTSFMPINEPNLDSDYSLDVGDILNIQLVGQKDDSEDYTINRDGTISIDNIGKITLAGLDLNQASSAIKSKIKSTYIGTEAFITLKGIRDVNVLITGNAKHPGIYTLTGNSNILHALSAAGGVSEFGSLREINLIRNDSVIETLDLYELLIIGNYNLKKRIRSGDVVFVKPRKNIVKIDGAVYRPAKYEVFDDQNLSSIIEYANGMKRTADIQNISLERILDGELKTIPILNKSQFNSVKAEDGDLIYIREYPFREVKISGAVMKPGTYIMSASESINDLVDKAGGFTKNAYLHGAIYTNEDAKKINKAANDILYQEFLDNIIALSQQNINSDFDVAPMIQLMKEIKNFDVNGRVIIDLEDQDVIEFYAVKESDHLFIPEKTSMVYVYGETSSEGAVMYFENKSLEYYVQKSGGYKRFADKKSIYILHPNGESQLYSHKRNIFESSPQSDIEIMPGSVIFIPRELDNSTPRRLAAQAYVSIIGNLGIALASLSSINNN